jgi:predicted aspartyl protease
MPMLRLALSALVAPLVMIAPLRLGIAAEPCSAPQSAELPVRVLRDMPIVAVSIDGKPATLLLDTGAQDTVLSTAAASRLGLAGHFEYPRRMGAVGGSAASGVAETHDFAVGPLDTLGFRIMVGPVAPPEVEGRHLDGLLGADFFADLSVDLDLPAGHVTLYRPQCLAEQPAWPPPFTALAANLSLHNHLFFPVTLDGHRLYAFIDTGAQRSVIDRDAALKIGVTAAQLAEAPSNTLRGAAAGTVAAQLHRFGELRIGDIDIQDPLLSVTPLGLVDADIILGEDFIEAHRIWLSYATPQVFIKGE